MSDDTVVQFERRKINEWPKVVYLADFGDGDGCRPLAYIQHPDDTTPHYVRGDIHDALSTHADGLEAKLAKARNEALEEAADRVRNFHEKGQITKPSDIRAMMEDGT